MKPSAMASLLQEAGARIQGAGQGGGVCPPRASVSSGGFALASEGPPATSPRPRLTPEASDGTFVPPTALSQGVRLDLQSPRRLASLSPAA